MSKVIEFELDYTLPETGYYCTCCKHTEIDHSGKYVTSADYKALEKERDEWKKRCTEEGEETARLFAYYEALEAEHNVALQTINKLDAIRAKLARLVEAADRVLAYYDASLGRKPDNYSEVIEHTLAAIKAAKVKP